MTSQQEVGVKLIVEGSAAFVGALNSARAAVSELGPEISRGLAQPFDMATMKAVALGTAVGNLAYGALRQAYGAIVNTASAAKDTAARFMELKEVAEMLGQQQGKSKATTDALIESIREKGITAAESADLVTQFTRYELDLAKATDLARVAQDAGVLTGKDSSEVLGRLMWGIQTLNTETLKSVGINVNSAQAQKDYAQELGKTVEQLTTAERSQAMMNAILKEGEKIAGSYSAAMETPGKQMRSFKRVLDDLMVSLGTPFMKAYLEYAKMLTNVTQKFTQATESGGKLYPLLQRLAGAVTGIVQAIRELAERGADALIDWLSKSEDDVANFINKFGDFAAQMLDYGFNLLANFAQGIAIAINEILVPVITQVADMISYFFKPGSPPKVAPEIDTWGKKTLEEWLKGFAEADFGILDAIQRPIKTALDMMVAAGKMDKKKSVSLYATWTTQIAEMIKTGKTSSSFIKTLTATLGDNGKQVAKLVKLYLKYSIGMREAIEAQKRLKELSKVQDELTDKASELLDEYNELVDSGASPEILKAKRDEIIATQTQIKENDKEAKALARKIKEAERANEPLREQIQLQEQIIAQLNEITQATIDANRERGKVGTGGGFGGITPEKKKEKTHAEKTEFGGEVKAEKEFEKTEAAMALTPFEESANKAKTAIDNIVDQIKAKLDELWKAPTYAGGEGGPFYEIQMSLSAISLTLSGSSFTGAMTTIMQLIDKVTANEGVIKGLIYFIIGSKVVSLFADLGFVLAKVGPVLNTIGTIALNAGPFLAGLGVKIAAFLTPALSSLGAVLAPIISSFVAFILPLLPLIAALLLLGIVIKLFGKQAAEAMKNLIGIFKGLVTLTGWFLEGIGKGIGKFFKETIPKFFDDAVEVGAKFVEGIKTGVQNAWDLFVETLTGGFEKLIAQIKKMLGIASPSKLAAKKIGAPFAEGIAYGIKDGMKMVEETLAEGLTTSIKPVISASVIQGRTAGTAAIGQNVTNYNLSLSSSQSQQQVERSFELMRILGS